MGEIVAEVSTNVHKSPALSSLENGLKTFTFGGVGAVSGSLIGHGSVPAAVSGVAVGRGLEMAVDYLTKLKRRRSSQAILDVVVQLTGGGTPLSWPW